MDHIDFLYMVLHVDLFFYALLFCLWRLSLGTSHFQIGNSNNFQGIGGSLITIILIAQGIEFYELQ